MRKNYVYLLFALFFAFSACQEEDVQSTVEEDAEEVEPITFTFIYKGKTYLETRSSETDSFQNKTIEDVLSTNDYSIFFDQKQKNTAYLFDNSEDAKSFFKASFSNSNARCSDEGNRGELVLWRDKSFEPAEKLIKHPNGNVERVVDASGSVRFEIDNYSNTSTPESILVPDLGVSPYRFNDKTLC